MNKHPQMKAKDLMEYSGVSRATASRLLTKLTQQGHLKKIGKGPATHYLKKQ